MISRKQRLVSQSLVLVLISFGILAGPILLLEHSTAQSPSQTFIKPLETPCEGGQLLTRLAYSECGPDGFWHVVEDDYYRCPDGVTRAFRVRDTPTTQPCKASTNTTIGSNAPGYHVGINNANGLFVTTVGTPQGNIKVNLPDDIAAGDTISGTVETEPAGKNDAERAQNQVELNGYVIELEGHKTPVGSKAFTFSIPIVLSPDAKTMVLLHDGTSIANIQIPIITAPPPKPTRFILPTGGQQGRPIRIIGACSGVFLTPDSVKIGGTIAAPLVESPRQIVVQNTSNTIGPTKIQCNENGAQLECPFRNIGIKLSAPKTNLMRGEKTELHVEVSGLSGLTQKLPLNVSNESNTVVKMNGGDTQHFEIKPGAVLANGTYSVDRTLTGIQPGSFTIDGTVTWTDNCNHDVGGGPIAGGPGPTAQPTPTPLTPTDTADGEVCKWKAYKTYRVEEWKQEKSNDKELEVRHSSAQGGGVTVEFHCTAAGTFTFTVTKESGDPDVVSVTCTKP